jgi:pyruvate kinase
MMSPTVEPNCFQPFNCPPSIKDEVVFKALEKKRENRQSKSPKKGNAAANSVRPKKLISFSDGKVELEKKKPWGDALQGIQKQHVNKNEEEDVDLP